LRITTEEVRHIATLARVGMTDDEVERMRDQMSNILEQFDVLSQVDTSGVESTGSLTGSNTAMRDDQVEPSADREDVLSNAPRREGDLIRVRAVLE
jgi:aspartyl-tRNA(Asn)/glutamyl-tRNA(Gln) amidotransferase subunit C